MNQDHAAKQTHHDFERFIQWLRRLRSRRQFITMEISMQAGEVTFVKPSLPLKAGDPFPYEE